MQFEVRSTVAYTHQTPFDVYSACCSLSIGLIIDKCVNYLLLNAQIWPFLYFLLQCMYFSASLSLRDCTCFKQVTCFKYVTWKNAKQQSSLWTELPSFDIDPVLPNIFPSCCLLFAVTLIHGCGLATLNVASPSHCMNYSMFSVIPRQSAWRVCMSLWGSAWTNSVFKV